MYNNDTKCNDSISISAEYLFFKLAIISSHSCYIFSVRCTQNVISDMLLAICLYIYKVEINLLSRNWFTQSENSSWSLNLYQWMVLIKIISSFLLGRKACSGADKNRKDSTVLWFLHREKFCLGVEYPGQSVLCINISEEISILISNIRRSFYSGVDHPGKLLSWCKIFRKISI